MATRATPAPQGPRLTDQLDQVVAIHVTGEVLTGDNEYGHYTVPGAEAVFGLAEPGLDPVYVPSIPLFWDVIRVQAVEQAVEAASAATASADDPSAGWLVGVLRKFKAYQITAEDLTDEDFNALVARLDAMLSAGVAEVTA